jgi:hypothetical protein
MKREGLQLPQGGKAERQLGVDVLKHPYGRA